MPRTKQSIFEGRLAHERREAERSQPYRDAYNDAPRVDLNGGEWDWDAVPPARETPSTTDVGDIERSMCRRREAIYRECGAPFQTQRGPKRSSRQKRRSQ